MIGSSLKTIQMYTGRRSLLGSLLAHHPAAVSTAIRRHGYSQRDRTGRQSLLVTSAVPSRDFYAVAVGRVPGVYLEWEGENEAQAQVKGHSGAKYKNCKTMGGERLSVHYRYSINQTGILVTHP